ncbi:MAG: zf-HC2 domain-containing protein [bacterium]|nr:zf-HC2 domain-containing protein [bacterium]
MKCEEVRKKIVEFLDGTLSEAQYHIIQQHIKGCDKCKKESEAINEIITSAKNIKIPEYDHSFWNTRYQMIITKAQERYRHQIFTRKLQVGFGFLAVLLIFFVSRPYFNEKKLTDFINVPEIAYNIPDEVLSEKTLPLPVDEMKQILDFLEPHDQATILAEYLH